MRPPSADINQEIKYGSLYLTRTLDINYGVVNIRWHEITKGKCRKRGDKSPMQCFEEIETFSSRLKIKKRVYCH